MRRCILRLFFIGFLASCEEPDDRYQGLYVFGSEVETFQPCASEKVLWVRGKTELRRLAAIQCEFDLAGVTGYFVRS